jgi:hypothetical protein
MSIVFSLQERWIELQQSLNTGSWSPGVVLFLLPF